MTRPMMVRPDTKAAEARQSRIVKARDKVCQFEKLTRAASSTGFLAELWQPCGVKSASDCAHLIRRPHLSPASRFHEDVAMLACRRCHTLFDSHDQTVRVPYDRALKAWNIACELSKVPPPIRYDPRQDARYGVTR